MNTPIDAALMRRVAEKCGWRLKHEPESNLPFWVNEKHYRLPMVDYEFADDEEMRVTTDGTEALKAHLRAQGYIIVITIELDGHTICDVYDPYWELVVMRQADTEAHALLLAVDELEVSDGS